MNYSTSDFDSFLIDTDDTSPTVFPGPSFEYDLYHQQTGIPRGALESTHNYNRAAGLHYNIGNGGFVLPTETLNIPLTDLDDEFDFSSSSAMFYPESSSGVTEFISPTTLTNTPTTPIKRIYPGMHSQQAAQAKAQQAQKQEQMAQQQQQLPQGQKALPTASSAKTPAPKDPLVEESISKVLNRMRQASATSLPEDEDSPTGGMSQMPRIKKDQDDMDEDELLLASEEGKKLTSKERRQLRNKVSARAFRSRRKEYIGQLEGEVAVKVQEANDLRVQNQQLREENSRLTDLTRMLLSSQAFSGFLQELSQSGLPPPNIQKSLQQPKPASTQSQPQVIKKDVPATTNAQQMQHQQPQIGMALIPETHVDFSALQPTNGWMNTLSTNDFQVYAVTELPQPPVLEMEGLSPKLMSNKDSSKQSKNVPQLSENPSTASTLSAAESNKVDDSVLLDQATFSLYFPQSTSQVDLDYPNASAINERLVESSDEDKLEALEKMCCGLDDTCGKLAEFTAQMD